MVPVVYFHKIISFPSLTGICMCEHWSSTCPGRLHLLVVVCVDEPDSYVGWSPDRVNHARQAEGPVPVPDAAIQTLSCLPYYLLASCVFFVLVLLAHSYLTLTDPGPVAVDGP